MQHVKITNILIALTALSIYGRLYAQYQPPTYSPGLPINKIKTWAPQIPVNDPADVIKPDKKVNEVMLNTQYFDGLGRPIQSVIRQGAQATGGIATDFVAPLYYDAFGRQTLQYMSYASTEANGNFKYNAFQQQKAFFDNQLQGQGETWYYAKTNLESSPLNRVQKTMIPGNNWVGSDRGATMQYLVNTTTDNVQIWNIGIPAGSLPSNGGAYKEGQLYKTIAKDVKGLQAIEYKDKDGHVILKKAQYTATADAGTGSVHAGWFCTYYVYDNYSRMRFTITPKAVQLIDGTWNISQNIADELCFRTEYDDRDLAIIRKNPGAGEEWMIYDQLGRPVFAQDANLRAQNKWLTTLYDDLGRPVLTGLIYYTGTVNQLRTIVKNQTSSSSISVGLDQDIVVNTPNTAGYIQAGNSITLDNGFSSAAEMTAEIISGRGSAIANMDVSCSPLPPGVTVDPLTITHYDDYSNLPSGLASGIMSFNSDDFIGSYNAAPDYAQEIKAGNNTLGLITWIQTKILGTNNYLSSANIYDKEGRIIQVQASNVDGDLDILTTQYSWKGTVLRLLEQHSKSNAGSNVQALTKMEYGDDSKLLSVTKKISGVVNGKTIPVTEKKIANYAYNELGQLKTKTLAPYFGGGTSLEALSYNYNIHGWTTAINKQFTIQDNTDNYFGMELGYDKTTTTNTTTTFQSALYSGSISGQLWKTKGDGVPRKYDYTYDNLNQLTKASFLQNAIDNVWDKNAINYTVNNISYDYNGNITALSQNGFVPGSGSPLIDNLNYTYHNEGNSNKLKNVVDNANNPQTTLGDFHYAATGKNSGSIDYTYDDNGNKITDANKNISLIAYNLLNLPWVISMPGKGSITYTYDAAGNKLKKEVRENNTVVKYNNVSYTTNITTVTTYAGGFVYQAKNYSNAALATLNINETLQFFGHEEGRIRSKLVDGGAQGEWIFDYFIQDHLGNVRMVLTDEEQRDNYPAATFEAAAQANEQLYYIKTDVGITDRPAQFGDVSSNGGKVQLLKKGTQSMGVGKLLKVMATDKINAAVDYYTPNEGTNNGSANGLNSVVSSLTGLIDGGAVGQMMKGAGTFVGSNLTAAAAFTDFLKPQTVAIPSTNPKAYINMLFFDEQFNFVAKCSEIVQITTKGSKAPLAIPAKEAPKNGYVYIYVNNESDNLVYFDNLRVTHIRGQLLEERHYYPQGLVMAGISSKAAGKLQTNFGYQGKELQSGEWADGTGLEEYDFEARYYDVQLARWGVQDPVKNYASPYSGMANNPVAFVDPDGKNPLLIAAIVGAAFGGYSGFKIGQANNATGWQMAGYVLGGAAIGAASGYVGGSIVQAGGFMSNTMGIMSSSMVNSMGMSALSGGQIAPNISFGFASFDFGSGEFGYLGKKGNSFLQNLGYTFGAMANVQDIVAGVHGTTLDVKSRKALSGHSQSNGTYTETDANGKLVTKDITISVGPEDQSIGQGNGLKWEMEYVRRSLKGAAVKGENVSYILPPSEDPLHRVPFVTKLNNVNGKWLSSMTDRLNAGRNLLNTNSLKYGLLNGCVNYNARALLFSGVVNANAFLPVTAPVLLNAELALRNIGMLASPYFLNY